MSARNWIQNPDEAFENSFTNNGIKPIRQVKNSPVTPAYNKGSLAERLAMDAKQVEEKFGESDPLEGKVYKNSAAYELKAQRSGDREGMSKEAFNQIEQKVGGNVVDTGISENATPLVFDPEVLSLLKDNAPHAFGRLTRRGQEGHQVVFNNISSRDDPAGYGTEADSANLQGLNKDFGFETPKVDLSIYMDAAAVTDFSAEASAHYMDISELAIGARLAEYAQLHEQTVFYGDPGTAGDADLDAGDTGGPGDPNAFKGLTSLYPENTTAPSSGVGEFIKAEIRDLLQSDYAVNPNDLEVWCSWALFDQLENELRGDHGRFAIDVDNLNLDWGNYELEAGGVPIVPGHNIDSHDFTDPADDTTYTVGDPNDVFIVNTATLEYRELLPMTTIPLAQRGASDEVGMVEFGTLIERSGSDAGNGSITDGSANFGKYLSGISAV
jgi:hypothetical protein